MEQQDQFLVRLSDGREFGPAEMPMISQWAREGRIPIDALLVNAANGEVKSVLADPTLRAILQAPPTVTTGLAPTVDPNVPGPAMVPYKNPAALVGYYMGVFSFVPGLGLVLAIPAIVLGIIGLVQRAKNPKIRGALHAILAIVFGIIGPLAWFALISLLSSRGW